MCSEIASGTRGGFSMEKTRPAVNVITTPSVTAAEGQANQSPIPAGGGTGPSSTVPDDDDDDDSSSSC